MCSDGGECNFSAGKEGEASPPATLRGGSGYKFNIWKAWRSKSAIGHRVLQATSALALPEARRCLTLAPCPPGAQEARPGRPVLPGPRRRVFSSPTAAWGSTEVLRASLLAGPGVVEGSCHTAQQAASGHWAPPGPAQARSPQPLSYPLSCVAP